MYGRIRISHPAIQILHRSVLSVLYQYGLHRDRHVHRRALLHYSKKEFVDKNREMRVRRSILLIVLVTIILSVVIGYRIVKRSLSKTT